MIASSNVQFGEGDFSAERGCGLLPEIRRFIDYCESQSTTGNVVARMPLLTLSNALNIAIQYTNSSEGSTDEKE